VIENLSLLVHYQCIVIQHQLGELCALLRGASKFLSCTSAAVAKMTVRHYAVTRFDASNQPLALHITKKKQFILVFLVFGKRPAQTQPSFSRSLTFVGPSGPSRDRRHPSFKLGTVPWFQRCVNRESNVVVIRISLRLSISLATICRPTQTNIRKQICFART
jgi:hypothetical protein